MNADETRGEVPRDRGVGPLRSGWCRTTQGREAMVHWYCRECKRSRPEEQMLCGWNGLRCPNCVWNDVIPEAGSGFGRAGPPMAMGARRMVLQARNGC